MTRKREQSPIGDNFQASIQKAWDAFDDPEHQERMRERERRAAEVAERKRRVAERKRVSARELRRRKLVAWGAPEVAAAVIADDAVKERKAVRAVRDNGGMSLLVLAGNSGCGKTLAACMRLDERETGWLVRAAELVELGNHFSDRDRLSVYRRCGVLIIDDMGVEYRDEQMICRVDAIIDARVSAGRPTLITTNLPGEDFELRYESRIWSRIHQFGDYIELDDPDLRITPIGSGRKP
ncbi:MAG: ATP-binding protein [Gammaproteobacteria bacterium]|nr:ATP-binding protein [Gammaproteobacteria bacterium]